MKRGLGDTDCLLVYEAVKDVAWIHVEPADMPPASAGTEARALEQTLGIPVLKHTDKKPAGGSSSLEEHFGYSFYPLQHHAQA